MARPGVDTKHSVHHLEVMDPPLPLTGGRMVSASGEMAQIVGDEDIRHVVYIDFEPNGRPRGNHYHVKMQMHGIYIIKGKVQVTLVDIDDQSRKSLTMTTGDFIRIKPRCAHVFVPEEYTQAIELNSTPFDPNDTIPFVILEPPKKKA